MSRTCQVTGKKRMVGNNRSHALNATRRTFEVNVSDTTLYSEILGRKVSMKVSAAGLRTIDHKGGLDAFLLDTAASKLDPALAKIKKQLEKAKATQAA